MKHLQKNILNIKLKRFSLNDVYSTFSIKDGLCKLKKFSYTPFFSMPAGDGDPACAVFVIILFCVWVLWYPYPYKTEYKNDDKSAGGAQEEPFDVSLEKIPPIDSNQGVDISFYDNIIEFFNRLDLFNLLINFLTESWIAANIIFLEVSAAHGALFIIKIFESKNEMLCLFIYFLGSCYRLGVWFIVWCYFKHKCITAWCYLKRAFRVLKYFFNKYIW